MNMSEVANEGLSSSSELESYELMDCLLLAATLEGRPTSAPAVSSGLPLENGRLTPKIFNRAANRAGLASLMLQRSLEDIPLEVLPAILLTTDGKALVLSGLDTALNLAFLTNPVTQEQTQADLKELQTIYSGKVFYLRPMQQFDSRTPKIHQEKGAHWFWDVLRSSSKIYRDVLLASFLINLFVLAQPLFVMNVYDRVVPNNAVETLWALAIGVLIVYVFDLALKLLRAYLVELAAKRTDVVLSAQLFEKVLNLQMSVRPSSAGAFASRIHDFDMLRNFVTSSTILTLIDLPFVIIFMIFIFYLGGWLVAVPIVIFPLAIYLGLRAQKKLRPTIENVMRGSAKKNATLIESLVGIETIKTLGAEGQVQRSWEQSVGYVSQWGLQSRLISNTALQSVQFLQQVAMVAIVVVGVYLIADQNLTLGGLIASVILNGRALAPLSQIASLLVSYDHAEGTLKSLNEVMALPVEREADKRYLHRPVLEGNIRLKQVTFSYPDQPRPAIENVDFTIKAGEKVGVIGRIGSGKSTLAKLMIRLYDVNEGAVLVDGFDVKQLDPADLRTNVGYVAQDAKLYFGTVRENITFGVQGVSDAEVVEAARKAGILELINSHPLGFEMPVGERGENLSSGQRSAISMARTFLRQPKVLLMDEPTSAMDQGTEESLCRQIKSEFADSTLFLITHKMSMLALVDRLMVVDRGTIVADGPKDQVLAALKEGKIRGKS
ncbi:type I secretion system permease/ATPase [Porticoccus litoralis]|uniref:Type I secretion system permease/ATPase n=1 Tax=Porticoccus litoralis TaxID=434086 RepID=A0AAW8B4H4_9GAMM|nr:type I secretion system permease/ATPase [Porticoccus litoralis]MDP1521114.1 type I secretion system permease/ATPase [Porticoccus litoralis]